jgi:hypothetical protein
VSEVFCHITSTAFRLLWLLLTPLQVVAILWPLLMYRMSPKMKRKALRLARAASLFELGFSRFALVLRWTKAIL